MKKAIKFCLKYGLKITFVTYYFQGVKIKRKGFDIYYPLHTVKFEPKNYNKGSIYERDKWKVTKKGETFYTEKITIKTLEYFL